MAPTYGFDPHPLARREGRRGEPLDIAGVRPGGGLGVAGGLVSWELDGGEKCRRKKGGVCIHPPQLWVSDWGLCVNLDSYG